MSSGVRVRIGVVTAVLMVAVAMGVASASEGDPTARPPTEECAVNATGLCDLADSDLPISSGTGVGQAGSGGSAVAPPGAAPGCPVGAEGMPLMDCGYYGYPPAGYLYGNDGSVAGVTASGQASLDGQGEDVRDEAIRLAVADAQHQAEVAADAAGAALGEVLDIQVSASPIFEPLPGGAEGGALPGGKGEDPSCPEGQTCVETDPYLVPIQTYVTVVVTWAIA